MKTMRMHPLGARWLFMESADTPMHTGVLAIFHKPLNAPKSYMSTLAAQMREYTEPAAPWNYQLAKSRAPGAAPKIVMVEEVDLDYHFHHSVLPAPGGERELGILVSRLHSQPLDRTRPLWECQLIEGLERDRFALYIKIHQSLICDINAAPLLLDCLSESARKRSMPPPWAVPLEGQRRNFDIKSMPKNAGEPIVSTGKALMSLLRAAFKPKSGSALLAPRGAPRSTLNRPINNQRRIATQQYELDRIKSLAAATNSNIDTVIAYLCGSSLRRFFKEYNALPSESLIGAVPVTLRDRDDSGPGKAVTVVGISLGTHIGDPLARLEAVRQSVEEARQHFATLPEEALTPYILLRTLPIIASQTTGLGRLVPPLFNLVISNMPSSNKPQYYDGAQLEALYPVAPLMQRSALSINCVSYAGTINVGLTGARDTLPHLQRLAVYMGQAAADLEDVLELAKGDKS